MNQVLYESDDSVLFYTVLLATAIHGAILLGVGFQVPKPPAKSPEQSLEITVVRPRPAPPPEEARFLAEANQEGGGNLDEPAKPTVNPAMEAPATIQTALHNETEPAPEPHPETTAPEHEEPELASVAPDERKATAETPPGKASRQPTVTAQQLLANLEREINDLTAELDRKTRLYAERPKRRSINAATQEHKYASYLESWRRKVEYVGNLNYPEEARRLQLYGDLILHVALRSDGSVEGIRVIRSSGHSVLDDAAINIVRLAAPFAPFPPGIKSEVDILDITRTWQFMKGNRLGSR
jgi:protein TonB